MFYDLYDLWFLKCFVFFPLFLYHVLSVEVRRRDCVISPFQMFFGLFEISGHVCPSENSKELLSKVDGGYMAITYPSLIAFQWFLAHTYRRSWCSYQLGNFCNIQLFDWVILGHPKASFFSLFLHQNKGKTFAPGSYNLNYFLKKFDMNLQKRWKELSATQFRVFPYYFLEYNDFFTQTEF